MRTCFLKGYGHCRGKLSGEHYFSRTVLEALDPDGKAKIGGLHWQPALTLQQIGIDSLISKILCEGHNSGLSPLDSVAGKLVRALDAIDKRPATVPALTCFDGQEVERWLLKALCGLAASKNAKGSTIPDSWKEILVGGTWPDGWGLYVPTVPGPTILATEFSLTTSIHPETKAVLAGRFRLAGVAFTLLLGAPDNPKAWGVHRPRCIAFDHGGARHEVEFAWPHQSATEVVYTRVGQTLDSPPDHRDWKE